MKSGMSIEQRDVLLVPFPFSDMRLVKQRPVLVISSNPFNIAQGDIVICQITSRLIEDSYAVLLSQQDMEQGELKAVSRIKPYRIFTMDKRLVMKRIGRVKNEKFGEVVAVLQKLFQK